ncbi:MAG: GntR family transcriptional regulator [Clostridia bacterium]|nr:GntR family transcriptional regulator [Clostridia bacterium]
MVTIDKFSRTPVYEQIAEGFCREVLCGLMKEGDQMPSVRELSVLLSTNPNTVQKAYLELDRRGVISTAPGVGTFIRQGALEALRESRKAKLADLAALANELKLAGIAEEEVQTLIHTVYSETNSNEKEQQL